MAYQKKTYKKFVATAATATLVATAMAPFASAAVSTATDFKDVDAQGRYAEAVQYLLDKGATKGLSDTEFGVSQNIKRQDAAVQLVSILGLEVDETLTKAANFTDVAPRTAPYVQALYDNGITIGKTETLFGANDEITRGELAIWIAKGFELQADADTEVKFSDVGERYADAVAKLVSNEVTQGKTESTFGTSEQATRGQFAIFLQKADLATQEAVVETVESIKQVDSTTLEVVISGDVKEVAATDFVFDNGLEVVKAEIKAEEGVKAASSDEEVKTTIVLTTSEQKQGVTYSLVSYKGQEVKEVSFEAPIVAATIAELKATTAKTLEVKFSQEVDPTKAAIAVKKAGINVNVSSIKFADDKKSATIELASKISKGEYTVSVSGLSEQPLVATYAAEDEKVSSIEILTETAIVNSSDKPTEATVAYQVKNQYGEDITKTIALTTNNADNIIAANGTITIKLNGETGIKGEVDGIVPVTLIHAESATTATKALKLTDAAKVADVKITGVYNKDGKELNEDSDLSKDAFYLLVDLKDQYGNVLSDDKYENGMIKAETNPTVATLDGVGQAVEIEELKIDGQTKLGIRIKESAEGIKAGESIVTLISTATGANASYTVKVAETQRSKSVSLASPELVVADEKALVPATVTDKQGNVITDVKVLNDKVKGVKATVGATPVEFVVEKGQTYVEVPKALVKEGVIVVVAQSSTYETTTLTLNVREAAKPVLITGFNKDFKTTTKYSGGKFEIGAKDIVFEDQYGRAMEKALEGGYTVEVAIVDGDGDVLTFAEGSATAITADGTVTIVPGSEEVGYEEVSLTLKDTKGVLVPTSTFEGTLRVTNGTEYKSFEVEQVGTAYVEASGENNPYEKAIKVYGVLSDGSKVLLDSNEYSIDSLDSKLALDLKDGDIDGKGDANAVDYFATAKDEEKSITKSFTVTINATGEEITQDVVLSREDIKVDSLYIIEEGTFNKKDAYVSELSYTGTTAFDASALDAEIDLVTMDQYGVTKVVPASEAKLTFTTVSGDVTYSGNGTAGAAVKVNKEDAVFNAKVTINGVSATLKVTAENATADVVVEQPAEEVVTPEAPAEEVVVKSENKNFTVAAPYTMDADTLTITVPAGTTAEQLLAAITLEDAKSVVKVFEQDGVTEVFADLAANQKVVVTAENATANTYKIVIQ